MTKPCIQAEITHILDCIPYPAILFTPDYRILTANQAYLVLHEAQHRLDAVIGRYCYEVSHHYDMPCDQAGETCPLKASERSGQAKRVLHLHHTPKGQEHVDVAIYPIHNAHGEVVYFLEVMEHTQMASTVAAEEGLVGASAAFNHMLSLIQRVAPTETTVLLLGESGTGKELVAKAVHEASNRADGPLVPVDCSGLTESLFESELFGHEKGSFTGAISRKQGLVEAAAGGTLFLDEVGDIPLTLQVKLLRLLETGTYRRVGEVDAHQADFRLVCATHRDLRKMVEEGSFRQDLYYRISAFPVFMPSLREREDDIPLLAESLLKRIRPHQKTKLSPSAIECLKAYAFPGNVRELRNILERACLLADTHLLLPEHLPEACRDLQTPERLPFGQDILSLDEMERRYLRWASTVHEGDRHSLAAKLGISERTLYRKLETLQPKSK